MMQIFCISAPDNVSWNTNRNYNCDLYLMVTTTSSHSQLRSESEGVFMINRRAHSGDGTTGGIVPWSPLDLA
jgi:hypothetical protein